MIQELLKEHPEIESLRLGNKATYAATPYKFYKLCNISRTSLKPIFSLPNLRLVHLSSGVERRYRSKVLKIPKIESKQINTVRLFGWPLTDRGLNDILSSCVTTLRTLDVGYTRVTGAVFSRFLRSEIRITRLYMSGCKLTDVELKHILQCCGDIIKVLDISRTRITGERLDEVSTMKLPVLEVLSLHKCTKLTDSGFVALMKICCNCKALDISETSFSRVNLHRVSLPYIEELLTYRYKQTCLADSYICDLIRNFGNSLKYLEVCVETAETWNRIDLHSTGMLLDKGFKMTRVEFGRDGRDGNGRCWWTWEIERYWYFSVFNELRWGIKKKR